MSEHTHEGDWAGAIRYMQHLEDKLDRQHKLIARLHSRVDGVKEPGHHCAYRQTVEALAGMTSHALNELGR